MVKKMYFLGMTLALVSCVLILPDKARADIKDGLISVWSFEEGTGSVTTDGVGTNNGELLAGYGGGVAPQWVEGKFGGALEFDGVSSFVNCGSHVSLQPEMVTISAWVKQEGELGYYAQIAGFATDSGSEESGYSIMGDDDSFGPPGYLMWISGGSETIDGTYSTPNSNYTLGEWTHVLATYDGVKAQVYVNGQTDLPHTAESGPIDYTYISEFYIGAYWTPEGPTDWWLPYAGLIDDVAVWDRPLTEDEIAWLYNGGAGNPAPRSLVIPTPANKAELVPISQVLSWEPKVGVTPISYDVYFGSDVNDLSPHYDFEQVLFDTTDTSYDPYDEDPMDFGQTYYWRIDVTEPNDLGTGVIVTEGFMFSFTVVTSNPVLNEGLPADVLVDEGEDVVFTVEAINPLTNDNTGLSYEWYKVGDPTALPETSNTLVVSDVMVANGDEGQYYCTVTVDSNGKTTDSRAAYLVIRREVGYWTFDKSLDDMIGGNTADYTGSKEKYTFGILGNAIDFSSTSDAATIDISSYGSPWWSLSWWDNSDADTAGAEWESMIANGEDTGFEILESDRHNTFNYETGFNITGSWAATSYYERGLWNHHVLTHDPETNTCVWYINGESFAELIGVDFTDFDTLLYVGNCKNESQPYEGLIDDLRLFNYPLSAIDVAVIYTTMTEEEVCAGNPEYDFSGPEGEPDCIVDMYDLALFLEGWLDCNLIPTSLCE